MFKLAVCEADQSGGSDGAALVLMPGRLAIARPIRLRQRSGSDYLDLISVTFAVPGGVYSSAVQFAAALAATRSSRIL